MSPTLRTKASLTSHGTRTYIMVTDKNQLNCKGHLPELRGFGDPPMKVGIHIILYMLTARVQMHPYLQGIYKRLGHVHLPCWYCTSSPVTSRVCMCCQIHSHEPCMYINPLACSQLQSYLGYSRSDTLVGNLGEYTLLHMQISSTPLSG